MTVLMLGQNREVGLLRAEVLARDGFRVLFPENKPQAFEMIEQGDFDAALVSYSLSSDTAQELVELIRQKCPGCPVVAISDHPWQDTKLMPDETVVGAAGPQVLVDALRRVERRRLRRVK